MSVAFHGQSPDLKARRRLIACTKCHARKVKCSGQKPCTCCVQSGAEAECVYPKRHYGTPRLNKAYVDDLIKENAELRQRLHHGHQDNGHDHVDDQSRPPGETSSSGTTVTAAVANLGQEDATGLDEEPQQPPQQQQRNPVCKERPWFVPNNTSVAAPPIFIGEAADSSFATRLRQSLSDDETAKHMPRSYYISDDLAWGLGRTPCPIPASNKAYLLVRAALRVAADQCHVVLRSSVLDDLGVFLSRRTQRGQESLDNNSNNDIFFNSRLWALLALGDLYTTRSVAPGCEYPGLAYFRQASPCLQLLQERPSVESIEILLLLALYLSACNRTHSAYRLAGVAVRLGIIMGLHVNVPLSQLNDAITRQHRIRLWWTAYQVDRAEAAKISHPAAIHDDDIEVDEPSDVGIPAERLADFAMTDYRVARLRLSRLCGHITKTLYGRRPPPQPWLQRVQHVLKDLHQWARYLPESLGIPDNNNSSSSTQQPASLLSQSLLLSFNQAVIVTTRPAFLYMLRPPPGNKHHGDVQVLTDACIRAARHSFSLLLDAWVDGTLPTLDNASTRLLYSVALVLAAATSIAKSPSPDHGDINHHNDTDFDDDKNPEKGHHDDVAAGLSSGGGHNDYDEEFDQVIQILSELHRGGNCAAEDYLHQLDAVRQCLMRRRRRSNKGSSSSSSNDGNDGGGGPLFPILGQGDHEQQQYNFEQIATTTTTAATVPVPADLVEAAGMSLAEPAMQAFLERAHMDSSNDQQPVVDMMSFLGSPIGNFEWA